MRIPSFPPAYRGAPNTAQVDNKVYQTLERLSAVQSARGMRTHVASTGVLSVNDQPAASFWAIVTGHTLAGGIPAYDWQMLIENNDGTYQRLTVDGVFGQGSDPTNTNTYFPAFEANQQVIGTSAVTLADGTVGTVVRMYWSYGPWVYFEVPPSTGASSTSLTYNNDTITYNSNTISSTSDTVTLTSDTVNISAELDMFGLMMFGCMLNINGPGFVEVNAPLEVAGSMVWDCNLIELPYNATLNNWNQNIATGAVTGATNTAPIVLTVPGWYQQPLVDDIIWVLGVKGNEAANGLWRVQAVTGTTVTLAHSDGTTAGAFAASPKSFVAPTTVVLDVAGNGATLTGLYPLSYSRIISTGAITNATNASPIVLTVPGWTAQGQPAVGQVVQVYGVEGNTAANGIWTVEAVTATTLTLQNSTGNGAFTASPASIVQPAAAQLLILHNVGPGPLTLNHNDPDSDPGNRILLPPTYGAAVTLEAGDTAWLWWDDCGSKCWSVISCTVDLETIPIIGGGNATISWDPTLLALTINDGTTKWCLPAAPCPSCGTSGGVTVSCCPGVSIPTTLHVSFSGAACPDLDGLTTTLTWDGSQWFGQPAVGGFNMPITLACTLFEGGLTWVLTLQCTATDPTNGEWQGPATTKTCSPFSLTFTGVTLSPNCCGSAAEGPFTVTIFA